MLEIQRENNRLRENISHIMSTPGRVDNWNFYEKKRSVKFRNNGVRTIGFSKK